MNKPNMIDRVALAISGRGNKVTREHIASARRAIEAMQQPSPAMRRVGSTFFDGEDASLNGAAAMAVYTAMIGAALAICAPASEIQETVDAPYSDQALNGR